MERGCKKRPCRSCGNPCGVECASDCTEKRSCCERADVRRDERRRVAEALRKVNLQAGMMGVEPDEPGRIAWREAADFVERMGR